LFKQICNHRVRFPFTHSEIDEDGKNLISRLLTKEPGDRIKYEELKIHPFFREIDWDKVEEMTYSFDIPFEQKCFANSPFSPEGENYIHLPNFSFQNATLIDSYETEGENQKSNIEIHISTP
jgi:serine/threonine protein kinase